MTFLSVENLSHWSPNGAALVRDVSFGLDAGSVLAIAGPNGAGKTTLLNLLSGLIPPTRGDILLDELSLASLSPQRRSQMIAVVSQHTQPDSRLRVCDYVALGQIPNWADRSTSEHAEALANVLRLTQLESMADRPVGQLSGGERQRAHIARALAQNPRLLFLDEPTNHLDPDAKGRMLSLISDLGITVVMVLHDLVMIPEFSSHALLLCKTRLQAFGPASEVLQPHTIHEIFGVDYLRLPYEGRHIPALDIRKTQTNPKRTP